MKHILTFLAAVVLLSACHKADDPVNVKFALCGDFRLESRDYKAAPSASTISHIYIFDNGSLVRTAVPSDNDFAAPELTLAVGQHHVTFVAAKDDNASSIANGTLTFDKLRDVFSKSVDLDVQVGMAAQSLTLDRVVCAFAFKATDAIDQQAVKYRIAFSMGSGSVSTTTGRAASHALHSQDVSIAASDRGHIDPYPYTVRTLAIDGNAWQSDITVSALDASDNVIATHTFTNVSCRANRLITAEGDFFSQSGGWSLNLDDHWADTTAIHF